MVIELILGVLWSLQKWLLKVSRTLLKGDVTNYRNKLLGEVKLTGGCGGTKVGVLWSFQKWLLKVSRTPLKEVIDYTNGDISTFSKSISETSYCDC